MSDSKGAPLVPSNTNGETTTGLVQEGWRHLQSQRPLAAWGSWQRALRVDPDSSVAKQALATLESATDLPLAARTAYRFREPGDRSRRDVWDARMEGWNPGDLVEASDLFARLAAETPTDSAAWYNRALCLAWLGDNRQSIACLDRVVRLESESAFDQSVGAWTLAEVLRQGGGAETPADDLRYACTIAWEPGDTPWLLEEFPEIARVPTPIAPGDTLDDSSLIEVFEWRDRAGAGLAGRHPRPPIYRSSWRAFSSVAMRSGCPALGSRRWNGSRTCYSRGSMLAPGRSGARPRRLRSRFSTPISGSFGSRPRSILP